ncbi:MAG: ABC transporter substrate-binding protein [Bacteroidaceae bacterium]|nr:ABC transporter substrate-binding protein [Bacteroidaceae bacterium]
MKLYHFLFVWTLLTCLVACNVKPGHTTSEGEAVSFKYAKLVRAERLDGKVRIEIRNPWDTTTILRSICVKTPIENAAVYSATHAALLQELGVAEHIGGIFDVNYLSNKDLHERLSSGDIRNLGNSNAVNIEQVMDLRPDLLMPSPYESQGGYGRLEQMNIPIMECADYMEISPLARAEWIRVYGMLFGVEQRADSLFEEVEKKYHELKSLASKQSNKVRLLTERPYGGAWHVPCGESTTGLLYQDAGAEYVFAHLPGSGAQAVSIEKVLEQGMTANLWLIKSYGPLSRTQLEQDCPAAKLIPARLAVCDTKNIPYFEETPFHPEYLLENLIALLHPELGIVPKKVYFE